MSPLPRLLSLLWLAVVLECGTVQPMTQSPGEATGAERGTLIGSVRTVPACPAQTVNTPCPSAPAVGIKLLILTPTGQEITAVITDDRGGYSISLLPGTYRLALAPRNGMEFTKDLPATVTITAQEETRLDIRLDTGMR